MARNVQAGEAVVMVAKVVVVVVEVVTTTLARVVVNMREGEWQAIVTRRGG